MKLKRSNRGTVLESVESSNSGINVEWSWNGPWRFNFHKTRHER